MSEMTTNRNEPSFRFQPALLRFTGIIVALLLIIPLLPGLISNLAYSFSGPAPKIYWYLSRSAGFVGLTILWVSMVLGLGITNKMAQRWPGAPAAFALHEYVSLLGLAFAIYHGLILLGDHFVDFSLPRLMVPFSIEYKTLWVGLGQVSFYIWLIVAVSFYARRRIGQKTWRLIHYVNFATYMMGLLHGIYSGTDSNLTWARAYYWVSGGILLVLLAYRLYDSPLKDRVSLSKIQLAWREKFAEIFSRLRDARQRLLPRQLPTFLIRLRKLDRLAVASDSAPVHINEESPALPAPEPAVDGQTHNPSESPLETSAVSDTTEASSALVEKYEIGSGENKVNVRIYKEPPTKPIIVEPSRDAEVKQVDPDTLVVRLKKDRAAKQSQRPPSDRIAKRIVILDE